ncbi:MAG TPA: hypothetical protein VMJ74_02110 [Pseudomonadales bacterium]|nr:hypothetical protein [Pseudomonadales bacterium]
MTPFAAAFTRWIESFANGTARLDPLARTRLRALSGRSVEIEIDPPGEIVWLRIDGESIRLRDATPKSGEECMDPPSVRVRGSPAAMAAMLFDVGAASPILEIEGDESVLGELRAIVRDFRPDGLPPLDDVVGARAAQTITGLLEVGVSALSALGRSVRDEGRRLARDGVKQRYLTAPDFNDLIDAMQQLRMRIDRLAVRTEMLEATRGERRG